MIVPMPIATQEENAENEENVLEPEEVLEIPINLSEKPSDPPIRRLEEFKKRETEGDRKLSRNSDSLEVSSLEHCPWWNCCTQTLVCPSF